MDEDEAEVDGGVFEFDRHAVDTWDTESTKAAKTEAIMSPLASISQDVHWHTAHLCKTPLLNFQSASYPKSTCILILKTLLIEHN